MERTLEDDFKELLPLLFKMPNPLLKRLIGIINAMLDVREVERRHGWM